MCPKHMKEAQKDSNSKVLSHEGLSQEFVKVKSEPLGE